MDNLPRPTLREYLAGWLDFWGYVLGPRERGQHFPDLSRWTIIRCRYQGHKCGVIYYNPGGLEPDMHCQDCNENLG